MDTTHKSIVAIVLLVFIASGSGHAQPPVPRPITPQVGGNEDKPKIAPYMLNLDGYLPVPFTLTKKCKTLWIHAETSGKKLALIVDNGATRSTIDLALAKRMEIKMEPGGVIAGFEGIGIKYNRATLKDLKIGDVSKDVISVNIMDMSSLNDVYKASDGMEYDGLLGADFLDDYSAIIDYRSRTLFLNDPIAWDRRQLLGEWAAVAYEEPSRKSTDANYLSRIHLVIDRESFRLVNPHASGGIIMSKFTLYPKESPKRYELSSVVKDGRVTKDIFAGIYEITEDRLRISFPDEVNWKPSVAPREFKTAVEYKHLVISFKRSGKK